MKKLLCAMLWLLALTISLAAQPGANTVNYGITARTLTGWTSGTSLNATQTLTTSLGPPAILLQLNQTSTISAGATTIEGTFDGTNWVTVPVAQILNPNTFAPLTNPYTLIASTNQPFLILPQLYQSVRIKLSTQITGSATVTPFVALANYNPVLGALLNPLAAGSAIIGKVGIDQTTPGTTNAVQTLLATSGGWTMKLLNGLTNSAVAIKASAGQLGKVYCWNPNATVAFMQVYNVAAGSVTVGATSPSQSYGIPPTNSSGYTLSVVGDQYGTAISAAATTTVAGGSAPSSALDCNASYN